MFTCFQGYTCLTYQNSTVAVFKGLELLSFATKKVASVCWFEILEFWQNHFGFEEKHHTFGVDEKKVLLLSAHSSNYNHLIVSRS